MVTNYAMAIWAAFAILCMHNCSAPTTLPWVQQWRSDAFTPAQKCRFLLQQKWVVDDAGCWHILNQLKTTTTCQHVPKKHIRKKPILLLCTVKMEGDTNVLQGRCIRWIAILWVVSIILHIQRRNWCTFHRSNGWCKKGRLFIAARTRGTLKQCQVFSHRAHQDEEDILTRTRAVFDRGHGTVQT
jgi:hypothetical protein